MYAVTVPEPGYSKATLLVAIGSSAVAGLALGYAVAKRELAAAGKANKASRVPSNMTGGTTWRSGGSENSTPAATPRSRSRQDLGAGLKLVLLVRTDIPLSQSEVAEHAARAVLGSFKKLYKRRDVNLRPWEESGHRIKVLGVDSQNDMLLQQAAARALTIPTHTFAADRVNKPRTVMAIGPAPEEQLAHITGHLRELIR
ncbi:hypothetical protein D9Q98_007210 [Chlorella vulgaris]|uniref:peptidyl-tRNA hydrolase n=1 Tax=Chlorella vulgaris TaxID=3077 RepID=A0A9D4YUR4_CHLVU|nr:hypothetical protein D9Q98_007210 [Chlorella vulgaris]